MNRFLIRVYFHLLFLTSFAFAQFEFNVEASRGGSGTQKVLVVDLFLKNTADSTVNILFSNQESCQLYFKIDDYISSYWTDCLPLSQEAQIPPNGSRHYKYFLYENEFGLPKFDGTHKVTAEILFYHPLVMPSASTRITIKDSTFFESPMGLGGRIDVMFNEDKDSIITLIKDSLRVKVLQRYFTSFSNKYKEIWQFVDVPIDSMAESLKSNPNLESVDVNRTLDYPLVSTITAVEKETDENIPTDFKLFQNYPNPFNPTTTISFTLPSHQGMTYAKSLHTELVIYDILGNKIKTLVDEEKSYGTYSIIFNAKEFSSGIYLYQLRYGSFIDTKKMLLLK